MRLRYLWAAIACALLLVLPVQARSKHHKDGFLRITRDSKKVPQFMQTAIATYKSASGQTVDLVAAVHLADSTYYRQLNQEFTHYDAVLYELIAPEAAVSDRDARLYKAMKMAPPRAIPQADEAPDNPLSQVQESMANLLGLTFQLRKIDYSRPNFVHADISPDEMSRSMQKRGESVTSMLLKLLQEGLKNSDDLSPMEEMRLNMSLMNMLVNGPTRRDQAVLRRVMAESFEDMEAVLGSFAGPGGSTLITVRNQKALAVLGQQLKHGKRHLAIFYGAGHMADMSTRLQKLAFKPAGVRWLSAWDLRVPKG